MKDISCSELLTLWRTNKKQEVIQILAEDHPGLTAVFLVQGLADRKLKTTDCNEISNNLIDLRREAFLKTL